MGVDARKTGLFVIAAWLAGAAPAFAAPRDDLLVAHASATEQAAAGELEAALRTLDAGVAAARRAGLSDDASLAAVHVMRAALLQNLGHGRGDVYFACLQAVRIDPLAEPPDTLQSDGVRAACERARAHAAHPIENLDHTPPRAIPYRDLELTATLKATPPIESRMVLYWRHAGMREYIAIEMERVGNSGRAVLPASEHRGLDVEYNIYVLDDFDQALGAAGSSEHPLRLSMPPPPPLPPPKRRPLPRGPKEPRVIMSLGLGVGLGIARGPAELTYRQFTDLDAYGEREQACAIARWFAADAALPRNGSALFHALQTISSGTPEVLPFEAGDDESMRRLVDAYDASTCSQRQPVSPRLAWSPLLLEPEVAVRVRRSLYVSAYARLQLVHGSRVYTDDPGKQLAESVAQDVLSPAPIGKRIVPPFSWALGAKLKYYFGHKRLRPFVGGFIGFGRARLRVPLGFSNDRNGNSVPDGRERAFNGPVDDNGLIQPGQCVAVWPYRGCTDPNAAALAGAVRARPRDERVDTVRLGPGFLGALGGVHFQATKHFALTAELQLGLWFPVNTTVLADLVAGPALTF